MNNLTSDRLRNEAATIPEGSLIQTVGSDIKYIDMYPVRNSKNEFEWIKYMQTLCPVMINDYSWSSPIWRPCAIPKAQDQTRCLIHVGKNPILELGNLKESKIQPIQNWTPNRNNEWGNDAQNRAGTLMRGYQSAVKTKQLLITAAQVIEEFSLRAGQTDAKLKDQLNQALKDAKNANQQLLDTRRSLADCTQNLNDCNRQFKQKVKENEQLQQLINSLTKDLNDCSLTLVSATSTMAQPAPEGKVPVQPIDFGEKLETFAIRAASAVYVSGENYENAADVLFDFAASNNYTIVTLRDFAQRVLDYKLYERDFRNEQTIYNAAKTITNREEIGGNVYNDMINEKRLNQIIDAAKQAQFTGIDNKIEKDQVEQAERDLISIGNDVQNEYKIKKEKSIAESNKIFNDWKQDNQGVELKILPTFDLNQSFDQPPQNRDEALGRSKKLAIELVNDHIALLDRDVQEIDTDVFRSIRRGDLYEANTDEYILGNFINPTSRYADVIEKWKLGSRLTTLGGQIKNQLDQRLLIQGRQMYPDPIFS